MKRRRRIMSQKLDEQHLWDYILYFIQIGIYEIGIWNRYMRQVYMK